jgi:trigger factor
MKIELNDLGSHTKKVEVLIPKETVKEKAEEIYAEVLKFAQIKGFRRGKAPRHVMKLHYGDYINSELSKKLITESLDQVVKEKELVVVSTPEIDSEPPKEDEDFKFSAKFDVKPEVKLEKYKGFELEKVKSDVKDELVGETLKRFQEVYASVEDAKDADYQVQAGDYAVVDIACESHPQVNRGNITVEAGRKGVVPGVDQAVVGMKAGEEKTLEVEFPEDHFIEEMRGIKASVKVTIKNIKHREIPELNDEFAKKVRPEVQTLDDLKKVVSDELVARTEQNSKLKMERDVVDKLIEANPMEIPESMVQLQASMMLQDTSRRLSVQGMKIQDLYPDTASLRDDYMKAGERMVKQSLIIDAIAKAEGIEASDAEVDAEIGQMAGKYNMTMEQTKKAMEEQGMAENIKFGLVEKKVLDYIISNSQVKEVEKPEAKDE